jgi:electron transfer flavoprotein beta subunit
MVNIIVCMKQVIDPEAPVSMFKVDPEAKRAIPPKATPPVLSPFDENALEAALKIKDAQGAKVTVLSMGQKLAKAVVRATLAAGADQLFMLEDASFADFDTHFTASTLAAAIKKIGEFDLILCGMQAADTDGGQVGSGIADILGIPCITVARKVDFSSGKVKVERVLPDGYEVLEAPVPVLITTSYEVGNLREPSVEAFMSAAKKPVTIWNAAQLGIGPAAKNRISMLKLQQPVSTTKCEIIPGATPEEAAAALATKLKNIKAI